MIEPENNYYDDTKLINNSELNGTSIRVSANVMPTADNDDIIIDDHSSKGPPKVALLSPMSPFAASATVVNLLLATGPFT